MSVSSRKDVAELFSSNKKYSIIFKIILNSSNKLNKFYIESITENKGEEETLLYPYFLFKIKSIKPKFLNNYDKNAAIITIVE